MIEVGDTPTAVEWYTAAMGFEIVFHDGGDPPDYLGLERDGVQLHMQSHHEPEWPGGGRIYRFLVDDPDALLAEFQRRSSAFDDREVIDTEWGTREFGQYDPDHNALMFYRPNPRPDPPE